MSKFTVADPVPSDVVLELQAYSPFLQQLLYNRELTSAPAVVNFLQPDYETHTHSPWLLPDMEVAVARILLAIKKNEAIVIYSDYDCDGIPGGVVLHDLFKAIGYTNFTNHIPHRHFEGFGLHSAAVEKLAVAGTKLIITVDCGSTDVVAVEKANELGVDVIITDHHQPSVVLPQAIAVVNPQIGDSYPFKGICGAAVAYKLAQAMIERGNFVLVPGIEKWWLDLVGMATIADMVPLVDENRVFAHYGLMVLRKSRRPGLQQLLRKQRTNIRFLTEDDIGFTIGPRINAASRMGTPEDAFYMLASTDEAEAGVRVDHLEKLNNERKGIVAAMTKEAHKRFKTFDTLPAVIVLGNPSWRPSLVGLVASKLAEEHGRPAFVWGRDGNGVLKGSCRSGGAASVHAIMSAVPTAVFLEFGGHHFSGGFSVNEQAIYTLSDVLNQAFVDAGSTVAIDLVHTVDYTFTPNAITADIMRAQQQLAPFGIGNQKPLYLITDLVPQDVALFGKTKEHTKLLFKSSGIVNEAIAFFALPEQFTVKPTVGQSVSLLAHLEEAFFMGRKQTRLRIVDVV